MQQNNLVKILYNIVSRIPDALVLDTQVRSRFTLLNGFVLSMSVHGRAQFAYKASLLDSLEYNLLYIENLLPIPSLWYARQIVRRICYNALG